MSATIATVRVVVFAVSGRSADLQAQGCWTPDHAGEAPDSGHAIQTVSLYTHTHILQLLTKDHPATDQDKLVRKQGIGLWWEVGGYECSWEETNNWTSRQKQTLLKRGVGGGRGKCGAVMVRGRVWRNVQVPVYMWSNEGARISFETCNLFLDCELQASYLQAVWLARKVTNHIANNSNNNINNKNQPTNQPTNQSYIPTGF